MSAESGALVDRVGNPQHWYGKDLQHRRDWIHEMSKAEQLEIRVAVAGAIEREVDLATLAAKDFPLPILGRSVREMGQQVKHGPGFALIRGFQSLDLSMEEKAYAFRGLAAHFGEAVAQDAANHLFGHETNLGRNDAASGTTEYETTGAVRFHTSPTDIVCLLCIRSGRSGGVSRVASVLTVWNEILRRHPELAAMANAPGSDEAIDLVDRIAARDDVRLDMALKPGDMLFFLGRSILRSRTAYEDEPEPSRRRHLLRLWLACAEGIELPNDMIAALGTTCQPVPERARGPGARLNVNLEPGGATDPKD